MTNLTVVRAIKAFAKSLPYKEQPYSKRNWGHPLHSLCSYQGKMKPAFAHWLVSLFSNEGMSVLDPLGGVGTVALEACLQGRKGITNDLSPFPYAVATAKVSAPSASSIHDAIARLSSGMRAVRVTAGDKEAAKFGLNGSVADFFHVSTLDEVLRARKYFLRLSKPRDSDLYVKACLLHVLHGNRPYALSRTSHPITPFHPRGPAIYKSVVEHVRRRADAMLKHPLPKGFRPGRSIEGSYLELPARIGEPVDRIITSPPFMGMRFDRPNWLRLWFCGWSADDFHQSGNSFLERQQAKSLDVYRGFFEVCFKVLRPGGLIVLHVGGATSHKMVEHLAGLAAEQFDVLATIAEDVRSVERHGILDKGLTTTHELIFARKLS